MTDEEARKIAGVIRTADGGCSFCVADLCRRMTAAGLGYEFVKTGNDVEAQAEWSDDPRDTQSWPEVIVRRLRP